MFFQPVARTRLCGQVFGRHVGHSDLMFSTSWRSRSRSARSCEPLDEPVHPSLERVGRKTGGESGVGGRVGNDVEGDVQAFGPGAVVQLDDLGRCLAQ